MNVIVTTNANKNGTSVTARTGNRRHTVSVSPGEDTASSHGRAARELVTKIVPSWRKSYVLNSVKVTKADTNRTAYRYND